MCGHSNPNNGHQQTEVAKYQQYSAHSKAGFHSIIFFIVLILSSMLITEANAYECLYVSSYHKGYEWNDGIEEGIEKTLKNTCTLDKFYMDSKRNPNESFIKEMAIKAKEYIDKTKPDVVIACDDNASKYLIMPYFKNDKLPFVFCGVNWTVEEYGYPYSNATGIIEIAPIRPLLKVIKSIVGRVKTGVYLSADVLTEHKDFQRYKSKYAEHGIDLKSAFVKTNEDWKKEFLKTQNADFIILNNNSGINDWNKEDIQQFVSTQESTLTVTNYDWMIPYAMLAMTKLPQEQGEWAAKVAQAVLSGENPGEIPIVINRRWNIYINEPLIDESTYTLPSTIASKAVRRGK